MPAWPGEGSLERARSDRAELVTDDAKALRERLETATGERISALEGIREAAREAPGGEKIKFREAEPEAVRDAGRGEEPPGSGKGRM